MRVNGNIARVGTGRVWRLGVTVFALLAFALQSYTTQTHMHKPATPGWGAIVAALDLTPPVKDGKTPIKQDQKTRGRVLILKELHDQIDAATADAYGWPRDLTDEQILERLVALNA